MNLATLSKRLDRIQERLSAGNGDPVEREKLKSDIEHFVMAMFKERMGTNFILGPHHKVICKFLTGVIIGDICRGIVNIPPGYTKTEMATISFIAYGIALNARARFLHLSYSHALALQNSNMARTTIKTELYQSHFPRAIKDDTNAKEIWWTTDNGGVRATSSMGQVTGFRAGHMDHSPVNFTGGLIIDDPVKPEDAYSEVMREGVNNNYNETIASRVAVENVPIIVIMQRIHWNDLSGYLLRGGSGEKWHHLNLPVIVDNSKPYPSDYTHGIPYEHGLDNGWLWPFKHNDEHMEALSSHKRKWRAQYLQDPIKRDEEFSLWKEWMISRARELKFDGISRTLVSVDPAVSNTESSDEHGIVGVCKYGKNQYGILRDYSRRGTPLEWANTAIKMYEDINADSIVIEQNQGGDMCESTLRNAGFKGRIIRVTARKGKALRAEPVAALYEQGQVSHSGNLALLEDEMLDFDITTQLAAGRSPNRLDAAVHGLVELAGTADAPKTETNHWLL
ncbi:terminase-like family protein [Vibrio phage 2.095.A._10N.286.46.E10]|nr:terminase-like family protein [Vibrio phage 2.095.A._10N.286.46.E10]AUS02160.1 terminase-like family protein [Vibrio phage 2.095.B._10N.286.46.E10]